MPTGVRELLLVGSGGALGSVARYLVSGWVQRAFGPVQGFPLGTLVVNVTGSLLIGLLAGLVLFRHLPGAGARLFLVVGLLGGYTTFSAFSLETVVLLRAGQVSAALLNVALQVGLGLAATAVALLVWRTS